MLLRVTLDIELVIQEVHAEILNTPYIIMQICVGWIREARKRIGRTQSCTLMELLRPLASAAYQTMHSVINENEKNKSNTPNDNFALEIRDNHKLVLALILSRSSRFLLPNVH